MTECSSLFYNKSANQHPYLGCEISQCPFNFLKINRIAANNEIRYPRTVTSMSLLGVAHICRMILIYFVASERFG